MSLQEGITLLSIGLDFFLLIGGLFAFLVMGWMFKRIYALEKIILAMKVKDGQDKLLADLLNGFDLGGPMAPHPTAPKKSADILKMVKKDDNLSKDDPIN